MNRNSSISSQRPSRSGTSVGRRVPGVVRRTVGSFSGATFDFGNVMSDLQASLTQSFNRPVVLVTFVFAFYLVVAAPTYDTSPLRPYIDKMGNNTVATWIKDNYPKFLGLVIFTPTVVDLQPNYRTTVAIISLAWVMLVSQKETWEYLFQSLCLHTYFRVRNQSRIAIVVVAALAFFFLQK
jgi:hypothetical protein